MKDFTFAEELRLGIAGDYNLDTLEKKDVDFQKYLIAFGSAALAMGQFIVYGVYAFTVYAAMQKIKS